MNENPKAPNQYQCKFCKKPLLLGAQYCFHCNGNFLQPVPKKEPLNDAEVWPPRTEQEIKQEIKHEKKTLTQLRSGSALIGGTLLLGTLFGVYRCSSVKSPNASPTIVAQTQPNTSNPSASHVVITTPTSANVATDSRRSKENHKVSKKTAQISSLTSQQRRHKRYPSNVLDIGAILGNNADFVNGMLHGHPFHVERDPPEEGFPNGLTERDYGTDGKAPLSRNVASFAVYFDEHGRAQEVMFIDVAPLLSGYTLSQWALVLKQIGLTDAGDPDSVGPLGVTWNSPNPYQMTISVDNTGHISDVDVKTRELEDRTEKAFATEE